MKWKPDHHGDKRERIIFALIPIICNDDYYHWLERIRVEEVIDWRGRWRIKSAKPL